jgi:hypothetical protein
MRRSRAGHRCARRGSAAHRDSGTLRGCHKPWGDELRCVLPRTWALVRVRTRPSVRSTTAFSPRETSKGVALVTSVHGCSKYQRTINCVAISIAVRSTGRCPWLGLGRAGGNVHDSGRFGGVICHTQRIQSGEIRVWTTR